MQLLKPNNRVAFWVHRGKQLQKCNKIGVRLAVTKHFPDFMHVMGNKIYPWKPEEEANKQ